MSDVDLRQLAIERGGPAPTHVRTGRHLLTRYGIPVALLVGFLALVAWASWDILFPPHPVTVIPVLATRSEVSHGGRPLFHAAGWIEPRPTPVRVAALAPGVVEQLFVVENQAVTAGQPIAQLVKDDAQLAHQRALADQKLREAELEQAKASLTAAKTRYENPVHLDAALGEANAALAKLETHWKNLPFETRRAEARWQFTQHDYDGKVAAEGVVAGRAIDEAKRELDTATALVEELRDRAESLEKERTALTQRRDALGIQLEMLADEIKDKEEAAAKVKAATARVQQARVAVAEAKLRLDRMTILAPINGRVYTLIGHPGARLGGGMTQRNGYDGSTIVTMYRPDSLQVRVDVRFEDILQVTLGQPVQIENPAISKPWIGRVLLISPLADVQKNTLEVKVAIDDPSPAFKPEMLVDATFLAPEVSASSAEPSKEMRIYVPQPLVKLGDRSEFVWVADQSAGLARQVPVTTGIVDTSGLVEITSGLTISSRLIATGTDGLQDGDRIVVTGEEPNLVSGSLPGGGKRSLLNRLPTGDIP